MLDGGLFLVDDLKGGERETGLGALVCFYAVNIVLCSLTLTSPSC